MSTIYVFGHQNPDTDAISSAISYSYFLQQKGEDATPVALGEANPETQFALDKFGFEAPKVVTSARPETDVVALVDHNEAQQSISDIAEVTVHSVVDHHRIANFQTVYPLYYTARPFGCTQTVIYDLYQAEGIDIPDNIAGMMLSGIISDTLLYSSPTTTPHDKEVAKALASQIGIDDEAYGTEMLKAGADVASKTTNEIVDGDAKSFPMGGKTIRIGQVNTVDVQDVLDRKEEVLAEMKRLSEAEGYDAFLLVITNILTNDSEGLYAGPEELKPHFEEAFNGKIEEDQLPLKGVVSRKKQIVPPLTESFE